MSFKDASLILECPKCETINYLDPFTFWNFKGKIKCAGCDAVFAYELENGHRKAPPAETKGPHDKVPGFAQTKDWKPITDPKKVAVGPQAREDFQGKPIPIHKSIRGKRVSGAPLKPEDLVGSVPKFFYSGGH
ncbi:MAG: hypothetical protein ACM319_07470 [Deltaproteobacteria bacterium]|nr:hypothetical protein [Candidatus Deferrimicrobiaceae bacterium]